MIKHLRVEIEYDDGREPRTFEQDYADCLTFQKLGYIFGDDFWKLLISCVRPTPDGRNVELIRDLVREEVKREIASHFVPPSVHRTGSAVSSPHPDWIRGIDF